MHSGIRVSETVAKGHEVFISLARLLQVGRLREEGAPGSLVEFESLASRSEGTSADDLKNRTSLVLTGGHESASGKVAGGGVGGTSGVDGAAFLQCE